MKESLESKEQRAATALAVFGPLNAVEVKKLLYPFKDPNPNYKPRSKDFTNDKLIDTALENLKKAGLAEYERVNTAGIETVQTEKIAYRSKASPVYRYRLDTEKAIEKFVSSHCDFSQELQKKIAKTIQRLWETTNLRGIRDENQEKRDRAWTEHLYEKGFDEIIKTIINDIILLYVLSHVSQEKYASKEYPNWQEFDDDTIFLLGAFRYRFTRDPMPNVLRAIMSKKHHKMYNFMSRGDPTISDPIVVRLSKKDSEWIKKHREKSKKTKPEK